MNILVTNDDGIDSPGLRKLAEAAGRFGRVWVIAPDGQRSAASHCYTWRSSVRVWEKAFPVAGVTAYACDGQPADCVRLGIFGLLPEKPDMVMAGINTGYNISYDIQYSATIGAVMEAALWGIHAIAFSQGDVAYGDVVDRYLGEVMEECMRRPLEKGQVWNVNFPCCESADCNGIKWDCRVSADDYYNDSYTQEVLPDGVRSFRLVMGRNWKGTPGTDLAAVTGNYVAVGKVRNIG
ncbi:MAG: 5'/3'-nucleotidase SurE [Eubacterium sp.]|nr:5'/3'-nucleotidase SurE [Eubacterium sp.]